MALHRIRDTLTDHEINSEFQCFSANAFAIDDYHLLVSHAHSSTLIPCLPIGFCRGIQGSAVTGGYFFAEEESSYSISQCAGKIVLCDKTTFKESFNELLSYGVIGFVLVSGKDSGLMSTQLKNSRKMDPSVPGVSISHEDKCTIKSSKPRTLSLLCRQTVGNFNSSNLIVRLPASGSSKGDVVIGAHIDSVYGIDGGCDNASGAALLVELAIALSGMRRAYDVSLVWFGCEEYGWIGSQHFVDNHPDISRVKLMVNLDSLGAEDIPLEIKYYPAQENAIDLERHCQVIGGDSSLARSKGSGDDLPFSRSGVSTVCLHRATPFLHSTMDTMSSIAFR